MTGRIRFERHASFQPVEYIQAARARRLAMDAVAKVFDDFDVVVAPTSGEQLVITNLTGHPAVILPNGLRGSDAPKYPWKTRAISRTQAAPELHKFDGFSENYTARPNCWHLRAPTRKRRDFISSIQSWRPGPKRSRMSHSLSRTASPSSEERPTKRVKKAESLEGAKDYFLRSARVRWSLTAVVRRVSGTFLLVVRRLRFHGVSMGSMCMVTSRGALGLLMRLRTTV